MSDLSMEQTRAQSDQELIRGGAIKSPDGKFAITDEQYGILHKEMESKLYKQRVEEAKNLIGEMPTEQFEAFQRELQYSLKYWSAAYQQAQVHIMDNISEDRERSNKPSAYDYYSHGKERIDAIAKSPLYDAIRARIRKDYEGGQNLPSDWAGWLGLQGKQDMEKINGAISTMLRSDLLISGLIGGEYRASNSMEQKKQLKGTEYRGYL